MILTILTVFSSTSCIGSYAKQEPLKNYDFSEDNIVEVRISSSPMFINLHGTVYGLRKGDSKECDEAISAIAEAWSALQEDAVFRKVKKYDAITTGRKWLRGCASCDSPTGRRANTPTTTASKSNRPTPICWAGRWASSPTAGRCCATCATTNRKSTRRTARR